MRIVPTPVTSARVFRNVEAHPHVALRPEVINFVRFQLVEQLHQINRIGQVAVMQEQPHAVDVRVGVEMIDPRCVKRARTTNDAVHFVAFFEQADRLDNCRPVR